MSTVQAAESTTPQELIYPRLKNGIYISAFTSPEEKSITVATSFHGIEICHGRARSIVEEFTGILSSVDIASKLEVPLTTIESIIKELLDANFLDTHRNTIKLNNRFQSTIAERAIHTKDQSKDAAYSQLQTRLAPELSHVTGINGVKDGGVDIMTARQNYGVEIIGHSRTATLLYSILLASGVTNTRLTLSASYKHVTIADSDLGSGLLRITDLGVNFKKRLEELSREWSLFPVASSYALAQRGAPKPTLPEKNLRIICGNFDALYVEKLVEEGFEHFFIGRAPGHVATIGPFVQPGVTPCRNCLGLIEAERNGVAALTTPTGTSDELPIAVAHHVAALAGHAALSFIDTGKCELLGAQLTVDFLDPLAPTLRNFPAHPSCTCLWPKEDLLL